MVLSQRTQYGNTTSSSQNSVLAPAAAAVAQFEPLKPLIPPISRSSTWFLLYDALNTSCCSTTHVACPFFRLCRLTTTEFRSTSLLILRVHETSLLLLARHVVLHITPEVPFKAFRAPLSRLALCRHNSSSVVAVLLFLLL